MDSVKIDDDNLSRVEMGAIALKKIIDKFESNPPTDRLGSALQISSYNAMIQTMNGLWMQWNNIEAFDTFSIEELETHRLSLLMITKLYSDVTYNSLRHLESLLPAVLSSDLEPTSQMRVA